MTRTPATPTPSTTLLDLAGVDLPSPAHVMTAVVDLPPGDPGVGDLVVDAVEHHLASRGRRLVPAAALPAADRVGPRVTDGPVSTAVILVQPLDPRGVAPVDWPTSIGPGSLVGLVGYGHRTGRTEDLDRRQAEAHARGADVAPEVVVIDAGALRRRGAPSAFEQIALEALLDALAPPATPAPVPAPAPKEPM